jgi:hypothetical protein
MMISLKFITGGPTVMWPFLFPENYYPEVRANREAPSGCNDRKQDFGIFIFRKGGVL